MICLSLFLHLVLLQVCQQAKCGSHQRLQLCFIHRLSSMIQIEVLWSMFELMPSTAWMLHWLNIELKAHVYIVNVIHWLLVRRPTCSIRMHCTLPVGVDFVLLGIYHVDS